MNVITLLACVSCGHDHSTLALGMALGFVFCLGITMVFFKPEDC